MYAADGSRAAILTVSDSRHRAQQTDTTGPLIRERLGNLPAEIVCQDVVPDEAEAIQSATARAITRAHIVVITGGTGLSPRDVTPQAVKPLLNYEVPGMAEAMRSAGLRSTPSAMLSRQLVGVAGRCLVVVLPGSPHAVAESLDAIWPVLPHAVALLADGAAPHPSS